MAGAMGAVLEKYVTMQGANGQLRCSDVWLGEETWRGKIANCMTEIVRAFCPGLAITYLRMATDAEAAAAASTKCKKLNVKQELAEAMAQEGPAPPWALRRKVASKLAQDPQLQNAPTKFAIKNAELRPAALSKEGTQDHMRAAGDLSAGQVVQVTRAAFPHAHLPTTNPRCYPQVTYKGKGGAAVTTGFCVVVQVEFVLFEKVPRPRTARSCPHPPLPADC